ncbi:MAG: flagellar hook-associated protein FlgL [Paraclostridium sp.]
MRVTNGMSVFNHTNAIQKNLQKKSKIDEKLNTMKEVNRLSDDPYKAIKVLNYNNEIASTEKYEKNCDEAMGWLDTTDSALDSLGNLTKNLKETLVSAGNGTYSEDEVNALSIKVKESMKEMVNILNTTHGGKYVFGGSETGEPPVSMDNDGNIVYNIDKDKLESGLKMAIGNGIDVEYNVKITDVFENFDKLNAISKDLDGLSKALAEGDNEKADEYMSKLTTEHQASVDEMFDNINSTRSTYGIKTNTVESMKKKNEEDLVMLKENLSVTQDVDFAEAYMQLKQAELTYTASIQTGAKVLQTTILNFL